MLVDLKKYKYAKNFDLENVFEPLKYNVQLWLVFRGNFINVLYQQEDGGIVSIFDKLKLTFYFKQKIFGNMAAMLESQNIGFLGLGPPKRC